MPSRPSESAVPAIVAVRVKPGASHERVGGCHEGPYGPAIVLAVRQRAVDGAATRAALAALAAALGVAKAEVRLRAGAMSRDKLFAIDAPPPDLAGRVARLLAGA